MSVETPKNKPEEIKNIEQAESIVEMPPEDFQMMIDEIPALRDQLQEWKIKLADLEKDPNADAKEIEQLKYDITDYQNQLSEREELPEE